MNRLLLTLTELTILKLMDFNTNVSYASLPVFLPTILANMGYSKINAQGLSAPPYLVAFLFTIITSFIADRTQQRALVLTTTSMVGGIGYVILATVTTVEVRYFAVCLAAAGVFSTTPNIVASTLSTHTALLSSLTWEVEADNRIPDNQGSDTRRDAGLVIINFVGQCGPVLGTRLYPKAEAPRYVKGMSICAAFMFFTALLALGLKMLLAWENGKLDQKYGKSVAGKKDQKRAIAAEDYGPNFRYVLKLREACDVLWCSNRWD